jgi:Domain of unknown function (DUF4111)
MAVHEDTHPGSGQPPTLPDAETAYLREIVARLQDCLGHRLVGVYLFGSAAYGAYVPGPSDLDLQAVVTESLGTPEWEEIARRLAHGTLPCPARRLEFVCYARSAIAPAARHPRFELNFNTGRDMPDHLTLDPAQESSHWFLLDVAMGRELGLALLGPDPAHVFAPIPRLWCLEALADSLAWHDAHESASANSVLNACRGWRYAATGAFGSKEAGAAWARQQPGCPPVVEQARREQRGGPLLGVSAVEALVEIITAAVQAAILRERANHRPPEETEGQPAPRR